MLRAFVIVLLSVVPAVAADEAFKLKLYQPKPGDRVETETAKDSKGTVTVEANGTPRVQEITTGEKEAYKEEILEVKEGVDKPIKSKRTYTVSERSNVVGRVVKTTKAMYANETVLIEKKGDKYEFAIGDRKLTETDAPDLFASFNRKGQQPSSRELMPAEAVKVGGTWTIPVEKSEKMFATLGEEKMKLDLKKSTISGKLLKAYKKGDAQFGVLELTLELRLTGLNIGGQMVDLKAGSKSVVTITVDTCIDGTVPGSTSKVLMTEDIVADLPNSSTLAITGKTTGSETTKPVKK